MNWNNLKSYQCPDCGASLDRETNPLIYKCKSEECDFSIGRDKCKEVLHSIYHPKKKK